MEATRTERWSGGDRALLVAMVVLGAVLGCKRRPHPHGMTAAPANCLDWYAPNAASERMKAMGLQGGGASFAGVFYGRFHGGSWDQFSGLHIEEEGTGIRVCCDNARALAQARELVARVETDPAALQQYVDRARRDQKIR
jgi:hypothetical protein